MAADGNDTPEIAALRRKARAAEAEFEIAIAYHETWKPAAFDEDVHARMGSSFATNALVTIRAALRSSTILALMRIWDGEKADLSMPKIARTLGDKRIVDVLAGRKMAEWPSLLDTTFARQQADVLRNNIVELRDLVTRYDAGGASHDVLKKLKDIRHEHLAHRKVSSQPKIRAQPTDDEMEAFFADMNRIIHLLNRILTSSDYRPEETAEAHARYAKFFWASVRGERTEGHPNYSPRPQLHRG